ncbi:putative cytochrome P450 [Corynespora cassiicola Philippines]|uniref:Putative cytochrome P450 n=1 Tax=Corynespora cassiicola Philippines TaxID=1448308 RepID=A0A2T2NWJ2_CORCC|nr:putative cytochrome P450 [Corynespora cassiicola Philippines]
MAAYTYVLPVALLAFAVWRVLQMGRRPKGYPPGPPTVPILGNLHLIPTKDSHLKFEEWAKQYGPIYSLILGAKVMIVLSKDQVVRDLIDKKSAIYSSRPDVHIGFDVLSGGHRMLMTPYGPKYRMQRKAAHLALNVNKSVAYIPYQEFENKQMMFDMLQKPDDFFEHFRRLTASLTTSIVYGFRFPNYADPKLHTIFASIDEFTLLVNKASAVLSDFFPILRHTPAFLFPTKHLAAAHHTKEKKMYKSFYLDTKHKIKHKLPSARTCTCVDVVSMQDQEGFSDDFATYIVGTFFEAGADTTASELQAFLQAMLLYPSALRRGQAEVDALCGDARWPTLDDWHRLPYVRACIKETLRWMPTTILGAMPHATIAEDTYMGYHIPRGAMVMINVWALHRDAERYAEPERFVPERYLGDDSTSQESLSKADVGERDHFVFGGGRRVCPGTHVAERTMFLTIARMLWAFDVEPEKGDDGRPVVPRQDEFIQGIVVHPVKFGCEITARSEKRARYVREMWKEAERELDAEGQFSRDII